MSSNWLVSILIFALILGVIVISHEFGHFAVARRNGIRVNEFDVGFGPTLLRKRIGETDFCLKLLPLGGACIFEGMDSLDEEERENLSPDAFPNAPVGARIATVVAGPMANFLIGYIFALIIVAFCGTDLPVINKVIEDSAAMEAGLQDGDTIVRLEITYERDGERKTVTVTPKFDEEAQRYYIGILGAGEAHKCSAPEVFKYGFYELGYWMKVTIKSIGTIFSGHFSKDDVSGPVGVVQVVNDTYTEAQPYGAMTVVLSMINLATLLTINLGIINLLPLPALDGGRLVFLIIEGVRGKPIPPEKEGMVHLAGFMALMALMVFVMFNDISRLFS